MTLEEHTASLIGNLGWRNLILQSQMDVMKQELDRRLAEERRTDQVDLWLYTVAGCGPCAAAEQLLTSAKATFRKVIVTDPLLQEIIKHKIGKAVYPLLYEHSTKTYKHLINGTNGPQFAAIRTAADDAA